MEGLWPLHMIRNFLLAAAEAVCLASAPALAAAQGTPAPNTKFSGFGDVISVHAGLLTDAGRIAIDYGHRNTCTYAVFGLPAVSINTVRGVGAVGRARGTTEINQTGMQNPTLSHASLAVVSEPTPTALGGIGLLALVGFGMLRRRQSAFLQG
jgi:MYXO-CTERM domain-containing protein